MGSVMFSSLPLSPRGPASGEDVDNDDQQDRPNDRDDKLTYQTVVFGIEQAEIADDKVGSDGAEDAKHQITQNAKAPTAHGAAREARSDRACDNLEGQIAKCRCDSHEYHENAPFGQAPRNIGVCRQSSTVRRYGPLVPLHLPLCL